MNNNIKYNTFQSLSKPDNNTLLFYIVTDNYTEVLKHITRDNVNKVIDTKNGYTPLHYAIQTNNDRLIKYFLTLDAEPAIKTKDGQDAFSLSLKYQSKCLFDNELKQRDDTISAQSKTIKNISVKLTNMETDNKYLIKRFDEANEKNNNLKKEIEYIKTDLKKANDTIKSTTDDLNKKTKVYNDLYNANVSLTNTHNKLKNEYDELNGKYNTLKRKAEEDEEAYVGLLNSIKKRK
jgi:ankyrin repeat protein